MLTYTGRPADGNETSAAYLKAIGSPHTPSVLALSRQNLPQLEGSTIERAAKGGYVVHEEKDADITIVSTGSEVGIAYDAGKKLSEQGIKARIVSLPCFSVFNEQPKDYRLEVLPNGAPILSVEAYSVFGWQEYAHESFGLKAFGASGPYLKVYEKFEITPEGVAKRAKTVVDFYKKRGAKIFSPIDTALDNHGGDIETTLDGK